MGFSVDVATPHLRRTSHEFCSNISHARMRQALDELDDLQLLAQGDVLTITHEDFQALYPWSTVEALLPGYNGVTLPWIDAAVDAPRMRRLAFLATVYNRPTAGVLSILADALTFAAANQGQVVFS